VTVTKIPNESFGNIPKGGPENGIQRGKFDLTVIRRIKLNRRIREIFRRGPERRKKRKGFEKPIENKKD
jgi:hypothetical protein